MIIIKSPLTCKSERSYIYDVVMRQFLGLTYTVVFEPRSTIELSMNGAGVMESGMDSETESSKRLVIADRFLQMDDAQWLSVASLPQLPLDEFEHRGVRMPVIYGVRSTSGRYYEKSSAHIYCGIDLFGSAMFMLSRYEECVVSQRDALDRFSAYDSVAYRAGFLHRPIINEYVELLWESLFALWPRMRRRRRTPRRLISHDVDWPFYVQGKRSFTIYKEVASDVIKRLDFQSGYKKAIGYWHARGGDLSRDPFNTFEWIMNMSEKTGIRSAFYFITEQMEHSLDGNYRIGDPAIQRLLRDIHARGHEIGLHPSFHTYLDRDSIKRQFDKLIRVAEANGIEQREWGGRQHYLRWRAPDTWQHYEDAGLNYDSTLTYADMLGFRCGVCYEYTAYNVKSRKPLKLKERPLIVMEQTVLHSSYMGLKGDHALDSITRHYEICKAFNGDFTLLWHNSQLVKDEEMRLYMKLLEIS